jgi:hypothetical protein
MALRKLTCVSRFVKGFLAGGVCREQTESLAKTRQPFEPDPDSAGGGKRESQFPVKGKLKPCSLATRGGLRGRGFSFSENCTAGTLTPLSSEIF